MKKLSFLVALMSILACQSSSTISQDSATVPTAKVIRTTGSIERLDQAIDQLIPKNAVIEVLAEGFTWTEGPLWIEKDQYLLFSDIPPNRVMKWSEKEGISTYLFPSGYTGKKERAGEPGSNALLLDSKDNLILCQHGDRRVAKMNASLSEPKSEFITIVDNYKNQQLNSPNDAVYDSNGNLFFTDPPYGLEKNVDDPAKELDFQGVYRYSTEGVLNLISDKITRPNGIGLSPDEKTLYVSCSDPAKALWMAFELNENGKVISEQLFYDATGSEGRGLPDGLKVDKHGNIWATGPGGVWIFNADGRILGKILTGEATSNCAFDSQQKTLYMTCDDYLMRVRL